MAALALCCWLTLASGAWCQTVKLPAEVKAPVGRLASVTVEYDGDDIRWVTPPSLDVFREYDPDPKKVRLRLIGYAPGTSQVFAYTCKGGKLSEPAVCTVVIGDAPPVPPPGPTPGPTPGPGPSPTPSPAPIPEAGFRVLVVVETADASKLPKEQLSVLQSQQVLGYLNAHCIAETDGRKGWRIWDQNLDASSDTPIWQAAFKRPRASVPWIIVSDGKTGWEGPLPADLNKTLELLKKYGGP